MKVLTNRIVRRVAVGVAGIFLASTAFAGSAYAYPSGYSVQGIDVSHHDGTITWSSVPTSLKFTFAKATEGTSYIDPNYSANRSGARSRGFFFGAYSFARPDIGYTTGKAQADYLYSHSAWANDYQTLPLMVDLEWPYKNSSGNYVAPYPCYGLSTSHMVTFIKDFVNEIKARTGRKPLIYTNTNWWNPCTGHSTALGSLAYLTVANYTSSPGTMPAGWSTYDFWQFTDAGTTAGLSGKGDQDVYHYSASALTALVSGSQWGHPTTYCTYTVNGTERNGPTSSFRSVKTYSGGSVTAGSDGEIDGYRRVADSSGIDGFGGFILATSMTKTSAPCFT